MMITIECKNDNILEKDISNRLRDFNKQQKEYFRNITDRNKKKCFFAFEGERLVGGAIGYIAYNWYYLDILFVDEKYRKHKIGSQILKLIEEYSKQENLTGVRMETWDFQALGFYEANGYEVFGKIEDCPPGTNEYHLKKVL